MDPGLPDVVAAPMTAASLAARLGGVVHGDAAVELTGCAILDDAGPRELAFVIHPRYFDRVNGSGAGCLLVGHEHANRWPDRTRWVHDEPYLALRGALFALHGERPAPAVGISPQAFIDPTAQLGELCTVRPGAYIAPRATIGRRVVIYPGVYVGKDAVVGDDCVLYPGVCVYAGCVLGDRVVLHANCVIGQDGLGYATALDPESGDARSHTTSCLPSAMPSSKTTSRWAPPAASTAPRSGQP